jgi:gliding motility-associated lipoprotein GldH
MGAIIYPTAQFKSRMNSRTALFGCFLVLTVILFSGCDRNVVFEEITEVNPDGWNSNDFKRFSFTIEDTAVPYDFYIDVRNRVDYSYSNLFLFIRTELPDQTSGRDTLDLWLADAEGKWLGSGLGKYRDCRILIMPSFRFPQPGEYIFELEHAMREPELKGIAATGIRVEKRIQ